ncbi:MAG: ATP-binding protein [Eubacteriales bacterium]|nr:ATP-binding protein [Eubacteriales bacterium]
MRDTRCSAGIGAAAASGSITLKESKLALADLDIENPYFRSRERQDDLRAAGVSVYSDPFGGRNGSELQTIDARILAPIEDEDTRIIIDTGGDRSGAMILNQFSRHFHDDYQLLSVVNCNRPGTDTVEKAAEQIKAAEEATGLKFTGLISNAHFIRFTTPEDVIAGYEFTKQVGEVTGLPVLCACAMESVVAELEAMKSRSDAAIDPCMEVFPIGMYMRDTYLDKQVLMSGAPGVSKEPSP